VRGLPFPAFQVARHTTLTEIHLGLRLFLSRNC
jgi:hypothetical protein